MSSELEVNSQQGNQNNFQAICQRRIIELEQKVNKYCAEYDALMNLLPMGNHLTSLLNFQKDFTQIGLNINRIDDKVKALNEREIDIDKNYWENTCKELENILKVNQKELHVVKLRQKEENQFDDSVKFEAKLNEKLKMHSDIISSKLAHHKNNIELKKHIEGHKTQEQVKKLIENKINAIFEPVFRELNEIEDGLYVSKLKVPRREVSKFHEFNFNRLMNELLEVNQQMEEIYSQFQKGKFGGKHKRKLTQKLNQVQREIDSLKYQILGSKNKCFDDLLTDQLVLHQSNHSFNAVQMQETLEKDFTELEINLAQLTEKFQNLQNYTSNC